MNTILDVKNLCKLYKVYKCQNEVLKNVNFSVLEGEMVSIMGPSGSGKSTLLYAISGMDHITEGEINFCGMNLASLSATRLADLRLNEMGFIFQQMYMLKNLNILDNIILPACQSKKDARSKKEKVQDAKELMNKLGITEIANNSINEVSGGQLQRACICRSMINKPNIIFADEPTGALNRTASKEVMDELVRINVDGTTIILVTHDVKVAARCSRVLFIVDGNIKGEYSLGKYTDTLELSERERVLNGWLMEMGW